MARTRPAAVGYRPDSFFLRNIFFKYFFFILGGSRRKTFSFVFISNWKSAEKSKKKSNRVRLVTAPWRRPFYRVLPSFFFFLFRPAVGAGTNSSGTAWWRRPFFFLPSFTGFFFWFFAITDRPEATGFFSFFFVNFFFWFPTHFSRSDDAFRPSEKKEATTKIKKRTLIERDGPVNGYRCLFFLFKFIF